MASTRRLWILKEIEASLGPALKAAGSRRGIVFGSHARGEADAWSNLDLIVVAVE